MADYPTDYYFGIVNKQPNVEKIYKATNQTATTSLYKYSTLLLNVYYNGLTFDQVLGLIGLENLN